MTEIRNAKQTCLGSDTHAAVLTGTVSVSQVLTPADAVNNGTTAGQSILPRIMNASILRLPSDDITTPPNSLMSFTVMIATALQGFATDVTIEIRRDGSPILGPSTLPATRISSQDVSSTHNVFITASGTHSYSINIIGTAHLIGRFATAIIFIQANDPHAGCFPGAKQHETVERTIINS